MRLNFKEPISPRYVHVNPQTNQVHLLVPIVRGIDIGADNTCRTAYALQQFFGKNAHIGIARSSALEELLRYKNALDYDISLLSNDNPIKKLKQDRLIQIERYIKAVDFIQTRAELNRLGGAFPEYPIAVQDLLSENSNCYSILLAPSETNSWLRCTNHVFSIRRDHARESLYTTLKNGYQTLRFAPHSDSKEVFKQSALATLANSTFNLELAQDTLATQMQTMYGITIDFTKSPTGDPITADYFYNILGIDDFASNEEYIDALIDLCAANYFDELSSSPFSVQEQYTIYASVGIEKLSIVTQFFLAQVNLYCYSNGLSPENFGAILDSNVTLREQIPSVVKRALEEGSSVEMALLSFINTNSNDFNLNRQLAPKEIREIQQKFSVLYNRIEGSPHFDEFIVFNPAKQGKFMTHQRAVCFDFSNMVEAFRLDDPYFKQTRQQATALPRIMPHSNEFIAGSFEIADEVLSDYITSLIQNESNMPTLVELLLTSTDNGQKVFERLDDETVAALINSRNWAQLQGFVGASINNQASLEAFNARFFAHDVVVNLTNDVLQGLYITAAEQLGSDAPGYTTTQELRKLLESLNITDTATIIPSNINGYVLTCTPAIKGHIEEAAASNQGKLYLSPAMARSLYQEAIQQYGGGSRMIQNMNRLTNTGRVPSKMIEVLRLLEIPHEGVSFTSRGNAERGFIVKTSPQAIESIQNIHQNQSRFHLTPVMARHLYLRVEQLGRGQEIVNLDNLSAPNKIIRALQILNLPFTNLSFNDVNGYLLTVTPSVQQQIINIAEGRAPAPLTRLQGGRELPIYPASPVSASGLFSRRENAVPRSAPSFEINEQGRNLLIALLRQESPRTTARNARFTEPAKGIKIGVSKSGEGKGQPVIVTRNHQINLVNSELQFVDKHTNPHRLITNPREQMRILNEVLLQLPENYLMEKYLAQQNALLQNSTNPARGGWIRLAAATSATHGVIPSNDAQRSWEWGRSGHTGNLCFASLNHQIEFKPDGSVAIQDKRNGYTSIEDPERRLSILSGLNDSFPALQGALQYAQESLGPDLDSGPSTSTSSRV